MNLFAALPEKGETEKTPVRTALIESWKQIIVGTARAALLGVGGFYLVTAFVVYYGVRILGYSSNVMLLGGRGAVQRHFSANDGGYTSRIRRP
jgi:hypothetical protein